MKTRKKYDNRDKSTKYRDNLRARRLLAQFLNLDVNSCKLNINKCSDVLLQFAANYNELVSKKNKIQKSLFD